MTKTNGAVARNAFTTRPANSRKLLARKAAEHAGAQPTGDLLEDSFPAPAQPAEEAALIALDTVAAVGDEVLTAAVAVAEPAALPGDEAGRDGEPAHTIAITDVDEEAEPDPAPLVLSEPAPEALSKTSSSEPAIAAPAVASWSDEDEATFQTMAARRKASGFQRRGRDVSDHVVRVGTVQPNPGTTVATIVAIVAEHGPLPRARLVELMAAATFAHPKARPSDKGWCVGYIAGALRDNFLALGDAAPEAGQ